MLGDVMRKKIKQYVFYILIIISIFILTGCSNHNEEQLLKDKLTSEIEYFDKVLSSMLNKANGLSIENYHVSAKKIEDKKENQGSSGQSQGGASSSKNGRSKFIWRRRRFIK